MVTIKRAEIDKKQQWESWRNIPIDSLTRFLPPAARTDISEVSRRTTILHGAKLCRNGEEFNLRLRAKQPVTPSPFSDFERSTKIALFTSIIAYVSCRTDPDQTDRFDDLVTARHPACLRRYTSAFELGSANRPPEDWCYCNFTYSALACLKTGTSRSALFQS